MLHRSHNPINGVRRSSPRIAAAVVLVAALSGCVSLDPAEERDQASSLVADRAETDTGWSSPWYEIAPQWDGRSPLSSDAAVRIALQNNRAIRTRVETIVASRADYVQAHLLPNPVLNLAVGFPTDGLGGTPLAAAAVQQLAWLWKRPAAIDAAEADLQRQVLAVSDAALRLVADVRQAHAEVVFAERATRLAAENIGLATRSAALLRDRFAVGEASRLDVNRVELEVLQSDIRVVDRGATLDRARRRLLALVGRADAPADWRTDDVVPVVDVAAGDALDETAVIRLAVTQRLDVAASLAAVEAQTARVELAERGALPDVGIGVGYQRNFSDRPGVFPAVSVTPKLFDDNSARIARAKSERRQTQIEADRVRETAVAETRHAWVDLLAQRTVVTSYRNDVLVLAASNLDLARNAFAAGEIDLTVLLEAQRGLNDARLELTDREHAAVGRLIELERAAGGSLRTPVPPALATEDAR